jgi:hypothetical protein
MESTVSSQLAMLTIASSKRCASQAGMGAQTPKRKDSQVLQIVLYNQSIIFGEDEGPSSTPPGRLRYPMLYHEMNPDPQRPDLFGMQLRPLLHLFAVEQLQLPEGGYCTLSPTEDDLPKFQKVYDEAVQTMRAASAGLVLSKGLPTPPAGNDGPRGPKGPSNLKIMGDILKKDILKKRD